MGLWQVEDNEKNPAKISEPASTLSTIEPNQPYDEDTIDLYSLWTAIKRHFWSILLTALVGASIAAAMTAFVLPSTYTSSSLMLVLTKETTLESLADFQIGSSLTNDYKILIQSRPVLEDVINNLGLDIPYGDLRGQISVTNQDDSRILQIDVEDEDPEMAKRIVDELASVSSSYIGDQMEITAPKIIERGELPVQKTSPNMRRNVVVGFLVGLLVAIAVVTVNLVTNDAIVTVDDVERYLGLITYASIPEREADSSKHRKPRKA